MPIPTKPPDFERRNISGSLQGKKGIHFSIKEAMTSGAIVLSSNQDQHPFSLTQSLLKCTNNTISNHATVHTEGAHYVESGLDDGEFLFTDVGDPLVELSFLLEYGIMINQQYQFPWPRPQGSVVMRLMPQIG